MAIFGVTLAAVVSLNSAKALAATVTWDGGGTDNNFTTDTNWDTDTAPVDGDMIVFPASVDADTTSGDDRALTNDIVGLSVAGIQFTGTYIADDYDYYTIAGNELTIGGDITVASGYPEFDLDVTLSSNISSAAYHLVKLGHTLSIGNHTLTISRTTYILGSVTGSGAINADASLTIRGAQTGYTGTITQNSSFLSINSCTMLNSATAIIVGTDARLYIDCGSTGGNVSVPITINSDGDDPYTPTIGTTIGTYYYSPLVINGSLSTVTQITVDSVTLNTNVTYDSYMASASTVAITALNKNGHTFTRVPGSGGRLTVGGVAVESDYNVFVITYSGSSVGTYSIEDKAKIVFNGNAPSRNYHVYPGGILGGTGILNAITADAGAMLAPGMSPGCLSSGNLTFAEGAVFEAQLGGTTACTEYDQQRVTGTVTLGSATLSTPLWNNYKPAAGNVYTIITNDGSDAVVGTFKNLAEGATYTQDGYVIQVSYAGGDGNDVTLTVKSVPKAPNTGFAPLTNNPLVTLATSVGASAAIALIVVRRKTTATTQK